MNKLGIVCGSLSRGGAERVSLYLAEYMKQQGIEVYILTASKAENEYKVPNDIERINLCNNRNKLYTLFIRIRRLKQIIKDKKIDTILIMGVPLCIYAIPGSIGTGAKVFVSERNDPWHFAGKKIVKVISRILMKKADGFVFQTHNAKKFYEKILNGKGVVIGNPLLMNCLPEPYAKREKKIVNVGRLNAQKNQKLLIQAFSKISDQIPDYKLIIYGEGNLRQELENEIHQRGMTDKILMPGNIINLHEQIKKASVFVMTSNFEGMPNALIEAMALELTCISTDFSCGGARELIETGINGILIPVNDKESLEGALLKVIEDPLYAETLAKNASNIRNILSPENIGQKWFEYLGTFR